MIDIHKFNGLKREASRRAKDTAALTLEEAQRQVALEHGYTTWPALVRDVRGPINPAPFPQVLTRDQQKMKKLA